MSCGQAEGSVGRVYQIRLDTRLNIKISRLFVILTAVDFCLILMFCARLAWQRCCALGDIAQRDNSTGIVIQARNDFHAPRAEASLWSCSGASTGRI